MQILEQERKTSSEVMANENFNYMIRLQSCHDRKQNSRLFFPGLRGNLVKIHCLGSDYSVSPVDFQQMELQSLNVLSQPTPDQARPGRSC